MKTITKLIYSAFAVIILAIGVMTANAAPGDVFVLDNGDNMIHRLARDGTEYSLSATGLNYPAGLALGK
jgi:hypothetical protein